MIRYLRLSLLAIFLIPGFATAEKGGCETRTTKFGAEIPFVEFVHPSGKKILFAGMIHVGGRNSYARVTEALGRWLKQASTHALILTEFFTCDSSVLDTKATKVSQQDAKRVVAEKYSFSADFWPLSMQQFEAVSDVFQVKKEACVMDVDETSLRPPYLVDRNKQVCDEFHGTGASCQWQDFALPAASYVEVESGDFKVDDYPDGFQFGASLLYRNWEPDESAKKWPDRLYKAIKKVERIGSSIIDEPRNKLVVSKTIDALFKRNFDRVVLPWGAKHIYGVKALLLGHGFRQASVESIPFLAREEAATHSILKAFVGVRCDTFDF